MRHTFLSFATTLAVLAFGVIGFGPATSLQAQEGGGGVKANLDLPFDAGGTNEEEEEAPEIVVFYGQQYEGDGIFFCCDKSGSMKEGTKFKKLQSEVTKNITAFSERVQFGMAFFDADLEKFPASGKPADASPAMKAAGIAYVMSQAADSGTCSKPALAACLTYAQQSTAKRKVIIYLSDGFQHCKGQDPAVYGREALAEVTQRNTARAQINAICIGIDVDEAWMRKLAQQNGGSFARIRN